MDVDAVLLSVQERDKWRRRVEVLTASLTEVRERRLRAQQRLRKIKRDLGRMRRYDEAIADENLRNQPYESAHARTQTYITNR
jgi:hypothetical protein